MVSLNSLYSFGVLVVIAVIWDSAVAIYCKKIDSCTCRMSDSGGIINLHSVGFKNGSARFSEVQGSDHYLYSFNPCIPFSVKKRNACDNVALCRHNTLGMDYKSLGRQDEVYFQYDYSNREPYLEFKPQGMCVAVIILSELFMY